MDIYVETSFTYFPERWIPPGKARREFNSSEFLLEIDMFHKYMYMHSCKRISYAIKIGNEIQDLFELTFQIYVFLLVVLTKSWEALSFFCKCQIESVLQNISLIRLYILIFIGTQDKTYFPDLWIPPGNANREFKSSEFRLSGVSTMFSMSSSSWKNAGTILEKIRLDCNVTNTI